MAIELRNPHTILAALQVRPHDVLEVRLHAQHPEGAWKAVAETAHDRRIPVRKSHARQPGKRRQKSGGTERIGAGAALVKEHSGVPLEDLFADAENRNSGRGLWLALDHLQDPHNVGAIFRTAAFFGVEGIVVTRDRSAPLTATVCDVSSGGIEHVPFAIATNLSRALKLAKEQGLWVLGSSEHAEKSIWEVPRDRPWLLAIGSEEKGLRRLTAENCDDVCRIPPQGNVGSLNASVAAGVMMAALVAPTKS